MADRIFVTYNKTVGPESFHTAINFERRDVAGNVIEHHVIEAFPQNRNLNLSQKFLGVLTEMSPRNVEPSIFGNIQAEIRGGTPEDVGLPYEWIAEEDDLSQNWQKIQDFVDEFNTRGFAYRGTTQNSNTFAGEALRAGGLPTARGVGTDPTDKPGNQYEYFAPGLNTQLDPPVGTR